jgi:hypothetical protein
VNESRESQVKKLRQLQPTDAAAAADSQNKQKQMSRNLNFKVCAKISSCTRV